MKTLRIAVLLLTPLSAFATTMIALDVETMSRTADSIVQGRVLKVEAHLTRDGRRVFTQIDVQVDEALKGQPPKTVTLTQPGGAVGDIGQLVSGTAHYQVGEEVVLFLEKYGPRYRTVGMAQGKFRVERSTDGKAAFAMPDPEGGATLVDALTHEPVTKSAQAVKLEAFKGQIRSALAPAFKDSAQ
jgi:hypothetical protein